MKKISNREEVNFYFKKVNELIDNYIRDHKVRPDEIHRYIKRNYQSFLEESGLSEIENIKPVVEDVLDHRLHSQLDGVLTFEKYNFLNEDIFQTISSNLEHEKALADFFGTSLGHINLIDKNLHLFSIDDFGKEKQAFIFKEDEISRIKSTIIDGITSEFKKKTVEVSELNGKDLGITISLKFSDVTEEMELRKKISEKLTVENLIDIMPKFFGTDIEVDMYDMVYKREMDGWHVWVIE